ncbi:OsmC family peroxiredoxin [Streptomyces sp. TRM70350]|nr:OsmC family peroxiredoxin [Streptomyces sp. TRM70350]
MGRVVLDTSCAPHDEGELWASLTAEEARRLAGPLLCQAAAVDPRAAALPGEVEAVPVAGDAFEIRTRGHVLMADQPQSARGTDTAPTPVELFVAPVALSVPAEFRKADDRPARVAALALTVRAPSLPSERLAALRAVVSHCTVTNVSCGEDETISAPGPGPAGR